jgi:hypothetical protein
MNDREIVDTYDTHRFRHDELPQSQRLFERQLLQNNKASTLVQTVTRLVTERNVYRLKILLEN